MLKFLYGKGATNSWFKVTELDRPLGVLLRQSNGTYITEPQNLSPKLVQTVSQLSLPVAFAIATESTEAIFDVISEEDHDVMLGDGLVLQVVNHMEDLVQYGLSPVGRFPYAVLLRAERIILVWHDDVDGVLQQGVSIEEKLLELVSLDHWKRHQESFDRELRN